MPANRVRHRLTEQAISEKAIALAAMIFLPSRLMRVLRQVARGDAVMLSGDHAAQAREVAFNLIGAAL